MAEVREIVVSAGGFVKGAAVTMPTEINSTDELKKISLAADEIEKIQKQVDFKVVKIILFQWSGSGMDELTAVVDKENVIFHYKRGLTKDLRSHAKVFMIPKKSNFTVK
ncbi:MAG: hypothetical protein R3B84_06760 [Zavarzinella sp.]